MNASERTSWHGYDDVFHYTFQKQMVFEHRSALLLVA